MWKRYLTFYSAIVFSVSALAQFRDAVPANDQEWVELNRFVAELDLTQAGYSLVPSKGGTSVYAVLSYNGKAIGAVIPENSASRLSGEIASYNLARILGFADLYQPGVYFHLTGDNLKAFASMIPTQPYYGAVFRNKEENRRALLARIAANGERGLPTAFKIWNAKPKEYEALIHSARLTLNSGHILRGGMHPVGEMLKCTGPQPSSQVVLLGKGKSTEMELVRQLSNIFLIDALTQQWDRFSGGNLQFVDQGGRARFVAFDNGGTWGGLKWTNRYLGLVSRFDARVARAILDLESFINGKKPEGYLGMRSQRDLLKVLGIEEIPADFARFKKSLALVAQHIRVNEGCVFD